MNHIYLSFLLSVCFWCCECYKILAIFPMASYSHYAISSKLLKELAERGHEVHVYTPFLEKTPVKNMKEIALTSLLEAMDEHRQHLFNLEEKSPLGLADFIMNICYDITEKVLKHEEIQKLLKSNEEYDLTILPQYSHEGLFGIAQHFKRPYVLLATMPLYSWGSFLLSHPTPPSYVPNLVSSHTPYMNFWQRLTNSFYDFWMILQHQWIILPKHRQLIQNYIPGQLDLYDFLNNASLVLINSHLSTYVALPQVPNAIDIGGLHIEKPKKLSDDLQKFLDDSVNGVIVFVLGSNLKSSNLPENKRNEILKAFSKLKLNVLWKWESDELPGQPKNVKTVKWLPQSDVLAHRNVKAFITHGGLLSIMESIYHGVPIIGIPFFADQKMNMAIAISYGYGIRIYFPDLNEENLSWAINEILNNPTYQTNVKSRSKIMRDRPMTPVESAIYWIEYVIRHNGAPHLKYPGMDLTWYQRNLLDVIAFIFIVIISVIFIVSSLFKRIFKKVCKTRSTDKKNN